MPKTVSIIEALDQFVERAYADGIAPPYDETLLKGILALAEIGYSNNERMISLGSAILNEMSSADRQSVMDRYIVPSRILRNVGMSVEWPEPSVVIDTLEPMSEGEESKYRERMERMINYHVESQVTRVVTPGERKQHTYVEKEKSARELLSLTNPENETAEDWPYLASEVEAGFEPDLVTAAQSIIATADNWNRLNAILERITRTGTRGVRTAPVEEIEAIVRDTNDQVTQLVDGAVVS